MFLSLSRFLMRVEVTDVSIIKPFRTRAAHRAAFTSQKRPKIQDNEVNFLRKMTHTLTHTHTVKYVYIDQSSIFLSLFAFPLFSFHFLYLPREEAGGVSLISFFLVSTVA